MGGDELALLDVDDASGAAGFDWADLGAAGTFTLLPVWNIIVRPAPSSAGAGAEGFGAAGAFGAGGTAGVAGFAAGFADGAVGCTCDAAATRLQATRAAATRAML